jgi:hypothetical protein
MAHIAKTGRLGRFKLGFLGCLVLAGASAAPARILVVGDSNAIGGGDVSPKEAWPVRLMQLLREPVQVFGAPGASFSSPMFGLGTTPRCESLASGVYGLRYAILALGTNELATTSTAETVDADVVAILKSVPAPWVCITPPARNYDTTNFVSTTGLSMDDVRSIITDECLAHGAVVIDGKALLPNEPRFLQADQVHLTREAHRMLAHEVFNVVK